ncbi:hypothetical protein PR048_011148 [Dryococelus australis]|uniref:Secreted protein n=1 Tax=Dryococelus australis TaxID=614101 RepID=A0ABQ9HKT5_9NEOP|nr:hypothetical protein PR048_011148 [Dryococelus australis]
MPAAIRHTSLLKLLLVRCRRQSGVFNVLIIICVFASQRQQQRINELQKDIHSGPFDVLVDHRRCQERGNFCKGRKDG